MAHVILVVTVKVNDAHVNEDTGPNLQTTLESAIQNAMPSLEEYGVENFNVTFEDVV
jgi:hypothetical protein